MAAFLLCCVIVAFGFLTRGSDDGDAAAPRGETPAVVAEPPIADGLAGPVTEDGTSLAVDQAQPGAQSGQAVAPAAPDPATAAASRVGTYRIAGEGAAALRQTVAKYGDSPAYQCSGQVTVRTEATALNVRSGPGTSYPVISRVSRNSAQPVLLWAWDEGQGSAATTRWFMLVDEQRKTVKGWVSGDFCDVSNVSFES